MTIEEAQKILPARVEGAWDDRLEQYVQVYHPGEDNPRGLWLSEAQYIEMAKAKERRSQHD